MALDQLMNTVVVDVAPVFALFAGEPITERGGMGFESRHRKLGIHHHLEAFVDGRKLRMENERWPTCERQRLLSVFFDQLDSKMPAVFFGFFQEASGNIVVMNVNGRGGHGYPLSN
jgi:hypothetical protein